MTEGLKAQLASIERRTERCAVLACAHVETLRRSGLSPAVLDQAQTALRQQLLWVERRLRELRRRKTARRGRLKERAAKDPGLRPHIGEHYEALRRIEGALHFERGVLRQIADSYAWIALREDPRIILPLYAPQTHGSPEKLGIAAPADIAHRAHAAGHLLVIENDLTRCLGIGDLTLVFASRPWRHPIPVEVKASGEWKLGAFAELSITAVVSDVPEDIAVFDELTNVVGEEVKPERVHKLERQDQIDRMLSHAQILVSTGVAQGTTLPGPSPRMWKSLDTVVLRALAYGSCYDLADAGVAFLAVRLDHTDDAKQRLLGITQDLASIGFERTSGSVSTGDLHREDEWAAVVQPIPLWPISRQARIALMTGNVFFAAVLKPNVWERAMQAESLTIEENGEGGWRLVGASGQMNLDVIEVQKLSLGVAFTGISPRDVAKRVAAHLAGLRK